jgi:hypothetical protein
MGWALFVMALFGFQWMLRLQQRKQREIRKARKKQWRDFNAGR